VENGNIFVTKCIMNIIPIEHSSITSSGVPSSSGVYSAPSSSCCSGSGSGSNCSSSSSGGRKRSSKWGPLLSVAECTTGSAGGEGEGVLIPSMTLSGLPVRLPTNSSCTSSTVAAATISDKADDTLKRRLDHDHLEDGINQLAAIKSPEPLRIQKKKSKLVIKTVSAGDLSALESVSSAGIDDTSSAIEWAGSTDSSGFYRCKISEILNGKYRVMSVLGEGVFASVVRCRPLTGAGDDLVAIKVSILTWNTLCTISESVQQIIKKKNESHYSGERELDLYRMLSNHSTSVPGGIPIVRFLDTFTVGGGHRCLVLENMHSNLR
jgi:hypothetical protein